MAICRIIETGVTPEQYIQLVTQLGVGESNPPPGGTIHIAAKGDDGKMRIIDVWDSRAQADEWGEKVMAVRKELGIGSDGPSPITYFEVHRVISA